MTEKGYHHTTTDDIAAAAGVSTGIIYRYFKDKHDILIDGLRFSVKTANSNNIEIFAENLLARFLAIHLDHRDIHEELEAMRHSDSEVATLYDKTEAAIILQITLMTICNLFYP